MDTIQLSLIFIMSSYLGSFYNVVALRTLTGEEIVFDRSRCNSCKKQLSLMDMIPIFSFLFYRGKCRYCKEKISYIYILGEVLTGISYIIILNRYGFTNMAIINLVFITIMILATITDIKEMIVPNSFLYLGLFLVLILRIIYKENVLNSLLNGIFSFIILYIIYKISGGKMGGADVKIYGLIGISIGFLNSMRSLFYASIVALIFLTLYYLKGNKIVNIKIPFIPFITIGVILTYVIFI